jgi:hypothetical protein
MRNAKTFIVLLSFTLALGACSSNDKPKENEAPVQTSSIKGKVLEPEMLINKKEAEELLGEAVVDGKKSETKVVGQKICFYNPVNTSSRKYLQISLTQDSFMPPTGVGSETVYRETKKMIGASKTDIKEFGNEAFLAVGGLHIFKDGYYILISSGNIDKDETLKNAGKKALENLAKVK